MSGAELLLSDLIGTQFKMDVPTSVFIEPISQGLGEEGKVSSHAIRIYVLSTDSTPVTLVNGAADPMVASAMNIVIVPARTPHSVSVDENVSGVVLSLSPKAFTHEVFAQKSILAVTGEVQDKLYLLLEELLEVNEQLNPAQQCEAYILAKRCESLLAALHLEQKIQGHSDAANGEMLTVFRRLIEEHALSHISVKEYAEAMGISVSTLNRLCQANLGQSPKHLIHLYLIGQAKQRLLYRQESVEDVALSLGFKDPAYFSRFFKQIVGITAGQFRQSGFATH